MHKLYAQSVFNYCLRRLRSREEAEDATQIVFLNAYRCFGQGIEPESERAWLFKIAEHVVMYRRRTISRRARLESPFDLERLADFILAPRQNRPSELDGLKEALARIPEAQRRAIVLREWCGLSYREVSTELGVSPSAAEALILRARRRLAEELGGTAPTSPRRRALSLTSPLAWLKYLLSGGTSLKAIAGATSAVVVAVGSAKVMLPHVPLLGRTAAPPAVVREAPTLARSAVQFVPAARPVVRKERVRVAHVQAVSSAPAGRAPVVEADPAEPPANPAPAKPVVNDAPAPDPVTPPAAPVTPVPDVPVVADLPTAQPPLADAPAPAVPQAPVVVAVTADPPVVAVPVVYSLASVPVDPAAQVPGPAAQAPGQSADPPGNAAFGQAQGGGPGGQGSNGAAPQGSSGGVGAGAPENNGVDAGSQEGNGVGPQAGANNGVGPQDPNGAAPQDPNGAAPQGQGVPPGPAPGDAAAPPPGGPGAHNRPV